VDPRITQVLKVDMVDMVDRAGPEVLESHSGRLNSCFLGGAEGDTLTLSKRIHSTGCSCGTWHRSYVGQMSHQHGRCAALEC
jgi:hypothetical protein